MSKRAKLLLLLIAAILPGIVLAQAVGNPEYINTPSDFPIIYTVGDAKPMVAALDSVAMIFGGGDSTANSFMGSGILAMLIGSIVIMLAGAISRTQMNIGAWALSVLLTFALFYPKTTVKVTSYFDASGGNAGPAQLYFVDNVPIGLAFPAGVFGMIGQKLSAAFDTTFTSADANGGFLALGTDGFAKPLRTLLGARDAFSCRNNSNFCNNLISYGKYCLNPASGVKADTSLLTEVDGIKKFFDSQTTGTMLWWDSDGSGSFAPCPAASAAIQDAMLRYTTNVTTPATGTYRIDIKSTFANDLAARMGMQDAKSESPGSSGGIGIDSSYNVVSTWTQQLGATISADNNAMMMNLVFPPHIKAMIESSSSENAEATYQQILREGMEKARVDMAGEGSMFVNLSVSAMNLFTFLFIAFTPIIALVIAAMGAQSVKLISSYMIFGLWTQTWMPTAAIISYYAQTSFFSKMSNLRYHGILSPEHIDKFYQDLANTMATSGTFMAATPMITLSLLTSSVLGMVSLANRAGGSGSNYLDENKAAPDVNKASNVDAISRQAESMGTPFAGGGGSGGTGPASGPTTYEAKTEGKISVGSGNNASIATNSELRQSLETATRNTQQAKAGYRLEYGDSYQATTEGGTGKDGSKANAVDYGGSYSLERNVGVKDGSSQDQTTSGKSSASAGIGGNAGAAAADAIPKGPVKQMTKMASLGVKTSAGASTEVSETDTTKRAISSDSGSTKRDVMQTSNSERAQQGESAHVRNAGSVSKSAKRAADEQHIRALEQTEAKAAAAMQSAAQRNESSESLSASTEVNLGDLRSQAKDKHIAGNGRTPGAAGGAAMRSAVGAIGAVAGSGERESQLKSQLDGFKNGYIQGGRDDDTATLLALRDMVMGGDIDAKAVGFKGIAAYASAVHNPAAKPLEARADRAMDNARATSQAQSVLRGLGAASFGDIATSTAGVQGAIKDSGVKLGADPHHPAGDQVPTAGQTQTKVNEIAGVAGALITHAKTKVESSLDSGKANAAGMKTGIDAMQHAKEKENADKAIGLIDNSDTERFGNKLIKAAKDILP